MPNIRKMTAYDTLKLMETDPIRVLDHRYLCVLERIAAYETYLEIGTGQGMEAVFLASMGKSVKTIDVSDQHLPDILKYIGEKNNVPDVELTIADFNDHDFNPVDVVFACQVVEHVRDYKAFVNKMIATAKKRVVITVPKGRCFYDPGHVHFFKGQDFDFIKEVDHHVEIDEIITKPKDLYTGDRALIIDITI